MVFNSYTFLIFFVVVLAIHHLPIPWRLKKLNLLLASYVFYAAWNPPFVLLLWISTLTAIVFIVGFPVAIFLAWVFDIEPSGVRRTGIGSVKGRTSIGAAVNLLVGGAALIYAIVWPRHEAVQADLIADANSIAVLPFSLQGQHEGNEYLSDGIAEEILYPLGSLTDLRVAARTSSFSFKGQNKTAGDISKALNVRHVVEGTIRLVGERPRFRVQGRQHLAT